jgi:hypothetical protein
VSKVAARLVHKDMAIIAIAAGVLAVCMVLASNILSSHFSSATGASATKAFYSDDDGATTFVDDAAKRPPFQHNGKEAVGVQMFKCGRTKFIGYLERYSEQSLAAIEAARRDRNFDPRALSAIRPDVKKPGQKLWVSPGSPEGQKILNVKCPDGRNDKIEIVSP